MSMKKTAPKACTPCRERKRKCDRKLQSCTLCYRLGRVCHYGLASPPSSVSSSRSSPGLVVQRSQARIKTKSLGPSFPQFAGSGISSSNSQSVHKTLTDHLSNAVGGVEDVRRVAARYFGTIHTWLPIISENSFYESLSYVFLRPVAENSLLCLTLALITYLPPEDGEVFSGEMESLYTLCKTCIAMVEAKDINSLAVVQARLLVTQFEIGHGLGAASISMGSLARAAAVLGINKLNVEGNSRVGEEGSRVWWAIVILDRYFTLEQGDGPTTTQNLGSPLHLPRDGIAWDEQAEPSYDPLPMSTPRTVCVGPFARQAQISHVINHLLLHLRDPRLQGTLDIEESDQLARTLLSFSELLPEDTPQPWPRYCGAVGMCLGALLILDESRLSHSKETGVSLSTEFLQSTLERMNFIAGYFVRNVGDVDFQAVTPFPPQSLFLAANIKDKLWRETGDIKHLEDARKIVSMLSVFSKRWLTARKYLRRIEGMRGKPFAVERENNGAKRRPTSIGMPIESVT